MARAIWTGSISFGLVNIPVQLMTATKDQQIHFHQLCPRDKSRVRQKLVCESKLEEVSRSEVLKGYAIAPDQYVIFEDEEIENLAPEKSQNIDVSDFVDHAQIDAIYFDRPYYLVPKENAARSYKLLLEAMKGQNKVGIAKFVMRGHEYLAALRPLENIICLEIMRFADEVVEPQEVASASLEKIKVKDSELKLAKQLIENLYTDFNPDAYQDDYRRRVREAIDAKAEGQEIVTGVAPAAKGTKVSDLMSALQNSLEAAKKRKKRASA